MSSLRLLADSFSDAQLREEIAERSERIRVEQAQVAELVAVLVERERRAAAASGRSDRAAELGATKTVQELTGVTRFEARGLVEIGAALAGDEAQTPTPWLTAVADATRTGELSVTKAQTIRTGLGEPSERISHVELTQAAEHLAQVAPQLTPEQLQAETRVVREQLDHQHVVDEERRIQDARSVKLHRHADGSGTLVAKLDREATVILAELLDNATGPRTQGPRFTSDSGRAYQERVRADLRSIEQLAHDALIAVLTLGVDADPNRLPGLRPAVRVLVTERDLRGGEGYGELEGKAQTVSIETVQRIRCETGETRIQVDAAGVPLNHGRTKRVFTHAQRTALAIRDGGCRAPWCNRPASWAEAHHIREWDADDGPTDLDNGILLCRTDHLDLHNRHAWIERDPSQDGYMWCEPDGTRRAMPSKARIQERLTA